jgi:hypothetical protein
MAIHSRRPGRGAQLTGRSREVSGRVRATAAFAARSSPPGRLDVCPARGGGGRRLGAPDYNAIDGAAL